MCRGTAGLIHLLLALAFAEPGELSMELLTLEAPGSELWNEEVAFRLKVEVDRNHSGLLEPQELRRLPCDAWQALDVVLDEGSPYPGLQRTYGFVGDGLLSSAALAIRPRHHRRAAGIIERCGVTPPRKASPAEEMYLLGMLANLSGAGSTVWEGVVSDALVATYDADGTQLIEGGELAGVDCAILVALELGLVREHHSLTGYLDRPGALGLASAGALAERIEVCIAPGPKEDLHNPAL